MSTSVTMPALGESVTEGTVTRWLKQEGDQVAADEPLLEVSTDKVDTEIPSPAAGVLQRIVVGEDETVAVGAELAVIGDEQADGGEQQAPAEQSGQQEEQKQEQQQQPQNEEPAQQAEQAEQQAEQQSEQQPAQQQESAPSGGDQSGQSSNSSDSSGGTSVTMPALGESVTEGTVTRWLKQEGDEVAADEPLLEVSTDKVDTEIPSPAAGVLQRIVVGEDETVAVGAELAVIGHAAGGGEEQSQQQAQQPAESPQAEQPQQEQEQPKPQQQPAASPSLTSAPAPTQAPAQQTRQQAPPFQQGPPPQAPQQQAQQEQAPQQQAPAPRHQAPAQQPESDGEGSAYVTPLVRKLAGEHGVDLSTLKGTGVGGRIRKQDVLEAATAARQQQAPAGTQAAGTPSAATPSADSATPTVSPLRGTTEKMSRLRKVIASRMVESLQVSAQLTTVVEVDLTRIARLRTRSKNAFEAREGVKLSFLPFLAKATIEALKVHPKLNASIDMEKGEITYYDAEHLGVAVDTERGLLVPVVRDAGDLNIAGLARKIADLAERTRTNKITPDELGGGTFTITNTGSRGALFDTPIINQPQV
ncbi:MAG: 2-oxo acid dehydrogenase subunit E2, partial [Sporichthyaceae bacterium]